MGVIYLLLYVASALWMTLLSWHLLADWVAGVPMDLPWTDVAVLVVMVIGAAVLHALALHRRGHGGLLQDAGAELQTSFWTGVLMLVGPPVIAWLQFEWYLEPVHMLPLWSLLGGVLVAYGVARRAVGQRLWAQPASMVAVALVGIPLGLLVSIGPANHFRDHLSPVALHLLMPGIETGSRQLVLPPVEPFRAPSLPSAMGEQTHSLLEALAHAEPVDVEAEQAAGRLRREPDGSWVRLAPDGTAVSVGGLTDLMQAMDEARAEDARSAETASIEAEAAWQQALQLRRDGGRLLGRQRP